ncbi:TetR family transcriptional regulator C-terminal domain-containing protein [Streptomyces sp. NPDC005878]|uniref:TetR family transcriptional regulator C-terminal domain-containing protein n=1 Tax=Streptomyces sp. NPDC005878 TaxID=3157077 RepID=UPI00340A1D0C
MPKQVDHEERRRLIADAVCRLADERGLEGVTLRDVAARAEVSMGAVQRCFRTKEEMLVFALGVVGERITARVRARLVASPAQSAATALGHAVGEVSLLAPEHRAEARVWLAFVAQAAVNEALADTLKASYASLHEVFARLIEEADESGGLGEPVDAQPSAPQAPASHPSAPQPPASHPSAPQPPASPPPAVQSLAFQPLDPQHEARALLALADGLTAHVLVGHLTARQAQDVLHTHVSRLWERPTRPRSG